MKLSSGGRRWIRLDSTACEHPVPVAGSMRGDRCRVQLNRRSARNPSGARGAGATEYAQSAFREYAGKRDVPGLCLDVCRFLRRKGQSQQERSSPSMTRAQKTERAVVIPAPHAEPPAGGIESRERCDHEIKQSRLEALADPWWGFGDAESVAPHPGMRPVALKHQPVFDAAWMQYGQVDVVAPPLQPGEQVPGGEFRMHRPVAGDPAEFTQGPPAAKMAQGRKRRAPAVRRCELRAPFEQVPAQGGRVRA